MEMIYMFIFINKNKTCLIKLTLNEYYNFVTKK